MYHDPQTDQGNLVWHMSSHRVYMDTRSYRDPKWWYVSSHKVYINTRAYSSWYPKVSQFGLAVMRWAGKRKDLGYIPLGSSSKVLVYGHLLDTSVHLKEEVILVGWQWAYYWCDVTIVSAILAKDKFVSRHNNIICILYTYSLLLSPTPGIWVPASTSSKTIRS